jgi:hypothetical protein
LLAHNAPMDTRDVGVRAREALCEAIRDMFAPPRQGAAAPAGRRVPPSQPEPTPNPDAELWEFKRSNQRADCPAASLRTA